MPTYPYSITVDHDHLLPLITSKYLETTYLPIDLLSYIDDQIPHFFIHSTAAINEIYVMHATKIGEYLKVTIDLNPTWRSGTSKINPYLLGPSISF